MAVDHRPEHSTGPDGSHPGRTLGRRVPRPIGPLSAPTAAEVAWTQTIAPRATRVPKGLFRYRSHEDANADWERWHADMVAATVRRGPRRDRP